MTPEVKEAYSIFFTDKGRVLLEHWSAKFGFSNKTTVVANDPITTAFNEGQRVVWCFITREIGASLTDVGRPATAETTEAANE